MEKFKNTFTKSIKKSSNDIIDNDLTFNEKKEDECEHSQNRLIDMISEEGKLGNAKSLYEIIYKLKHNTDLNELINMKLKDNTHKIKNIIK